MSDFPNLQKLATITDVDEYIFKVLSSFEIYRFSQKNNRYELESIISLKSIPQSSYEYLDKDRFYSLRQYRAHYPEIGEILTYI